ncbi:uncharacterized protein LOC111033390 [Myzus persicae]|uniref:uncharacterized protein LOC111033390 n=1 Tax=Myzus persicae TaxID=13164 RepID=UPI000B93176E|nr:uncharacterized protein LOC111033390 [Myzus persicae]
MADEFTISKLKEWKLENCIEKFKDECIDSEALVCLTELMIKDLIPQMGYQAKLLKGINELKTKSSINTELIEITNQVDMNFEDLNNFPIEIINNTIDSDVYIQSNTEPNYSDNVVIEDTSLNNSNKYLIFVCPNRLIMK